MADTPANNRLFDGETFKGELKTHFDVLYTNGDFLRLIRSVAAEYFKLPIDAFKASVGYDDNGTVHTASDEASKARQKLIYVFNTFLVKNGKSDSTSIIVKRFGHTPVAIKSMLNAVKDALTDEAKLGQTAHKDDLTILTLKIIMRVMETSPSGRRLQAEAEAAAPTRPTPDAPSVQVDAANVARKG